ncbi:serine hydrolase [Rickettsiales endosymbiont of Stachyamoeba lipophora]|uniref:serine hydrolase n=1 Tax=Rickettsiales endosymbiont of Stachyamoeba lipophora TaxID=2486578 RepID=UPI000F64B314|nr:serine hydrolase [Rickettsiales endosymbiont of Stachyamoeba lipophora]AZL15847.1 serine hydrolase [Rickettsiales endosymbiont of Stachyamoeba lipophora]
MKFFIIIFFWLINITQADDLTHLIHSLEKQYNAKIGVSITNVNHNVSYHHRENEHFKMASTVKLPLAVYWLYLLEHNKVNFDELVEIKPNDLVPGSGKLGYFVLHPGFQISYRNIFEPMLTISDNTATDMIFKKVGGANNLRKFLINQGFNQIWVNRSIMGLFFDARNYPKLVPYKGRHLGWWHDEWSKLKQSKAHIKRASDQFHTDVRDTATPLQMNQLLINIANYKVINKQSFDYLFDVMSRCSTSENRVKKWLPKGVVIHKTGTWDNIHYQYLGDVGYIQTRKGMVAYSIYVETKLSKKTQGNLVSEDIFAQLGKVIYENY